jgi:hypothetical protein
MKPDKASAVFFVVLSIVILWSSYRLRLGTFANPGPGLLPFLAGFGLGVVSVIHLLRHGTGILHQGEITVRQLWAGMNWTKSAGIAVSLVLYTTLLDYLGFLATTTLLMIFLFRVVEPMRWFVATGSGLVASLVSYVLFAVWLQVQLPRGLIENLLFR